MKSQALLEKKAKKEEGRRRAKIIAQQRRKAREEAEENGFSSSTPTQTSTRHGARNQRRHQKFILWLLKTFDFLEEGSNVVDVAGGKGELAVRMAYCHQLNVCIIDPREADVCKCFTDVVLPKLPKKWQQIFKDKSESYGENYLSEVVFSKSVQQIVSYFDDSPFISSSFPSTHMSESTKNEMIRIISSCSLLVGMHADSATEAIVDVALALNKVKCPNETDS